MKKSLLIIFSITLFIACTHKMASTAKPKVDAAAMFESDIKPILVAKCSPCHFPSKGGGKASLENFIAAGTNIDDVIVRVQLDPSSPQYMPFRGKRDPLTAAEIASLKAWKEALQQK
jgi:hypothetical protein